MFSSQESRATWMYSFATTFSEICRKLETDIMHMVIKSRISFYTDFHYNFRMVFQGKLFHNILKTGKKITKIFFTTNICEHFNFTHSILQEKRV